MSRSLEDLLRKYRHLCWYPSANADFRGLLYLSRRYFQWKLLPMDPGQVLPDLFIMTDVCPREGICYTPVNSWAGGEQGRSDIHFLRDERWRNIRELYTGFRQASWDGSGARRKVTEITVKDIERLEDLELVYQPSFFTCIESEDRPAWYGRVFRIRAHVASLQREDAGEHRLYEYDQDVVYILADNTAFARDVLLRKGIPVEYVIQIRYGEAFGGSALPGNWVPALLKDLGCRYFMANPRYAVPEAAYIPERLEGFFAGYEARTPRFKWMAILRDYRHCLYWSACDNFDDIYLFRLL